MKRIALVAAIGLVLVCGLGMGVAVWLARSNTPNINTLPVYPNAQNVQRVTSNGQWQTYGSSSTSVQGSGTTGSFNWTPIGSVPGSESVHFETNDSAQRVYDFYDNWFTTHGWQAPGQSSQTSGFYIMYGPPDFTLISLAYGNGQPFPSFHIPRRLYTAIVMASSIGRGSQSTWVNVSLFQLPPR